MGLLRRLKHLWKLSAYDVRDSAGENKLVKEIVTIKPKPATIIPPETEDPFKPNDTTH